MYATLEQIGQLGHEEKEGARVYATEGSLIARHSRGAARSKLEEVARGRERMAFLQGIHWERHRLARLARGETSLEELRGRLGLPNL